METVVPLKPSVLNLTDDEITEFEGMIKDKLLPPDWLDRCDEARRTNVFGIGHKTGRGGKPIEMGIGSENQMSANSIQAYKKYCQNEPDFERHLARMEKLLAEQQAQRQAQQPRAGRR
jgi:hypothetical protein